MRQRVGSQYINEQRYSGRMRGSSHQHLKREIAFHCCRKDCCLPVSAGPETNPVVVVAQAERGRWRGRLGRGVL